ncbi:MAG: hypothetical protein HUU38_12520 [Anaerolineales bacterium]|nr:hypothetical protein [Anaerolineales bacterium]
MTVIFEIYKHGSYSHPLRHYALGRISHADGTFWLDLQLRWNPYHAQQKEAGQLVNTFTLICMPEISGIKSLSSYKTSAKIHSVTQSVMSSFQIHPSVSF